MDLSYTVRSAVRPGLDSAYLYSPVKGIPTPVRLQVMASGPLCLSAINFSSATEGFAVSTRRDAAGIGLP
jgi:hypothetical protein